jgi:hypothetical protein
MTASTLVLSPEPSYQATLSEDVATPEVYVPHVQSQFVTVLPLVVVVGARKGPLNH